MAAAILEFMTKGGGGFDGRPAVATAPGAIAFTKGMPQGEQGKGTQGSTIQCANPQALELVSVKQQGEIGWPCN